MQLVETGTKKMQAVQTRPRLGGLSCPWNHKSGLTQNHKC